MLISLQERKLTAAARWGTMALLALTLLAASAASAAPPSLLPTLPREIMGVPSHLAGHFLMYAVLGGELALVLVAFGVLRRYPVVGVGTAFVACAGYGALMELYQRGVPGRVPSVADALANSAGAAVGVVFVTAAVLAFGWWRRG